MPYFVSSIIAVVSAMIIMFTRYEADDSSITAELESVKSMFSTINGFVNTYIETGGDLTKVNFEVLFDAGILSGNIRQSDENATDKELERINALKSKIDSIETIVQTAIDEKLQPIQETLQLMTTVITTMNNDIRTLLRKVEENNHNSKVTSTEKEDTE